LTAEVRAPARGSSWWLPGAPLLCVAALIAVEATLIAPGHLLAGDIVDAALVLFLVSVTAGTVVGERSMRPAAALLAMRALALVALVRVVGLGLPLHDGSEALGTLAVAVLIGFAAIRTGPLVGVSLRTLTQMRSPLVQAAAAGAGLALGLVAYLLGAPRLWPQGAGAGRVLLGLIAAVAAAGVEEIVFRGVVQVSLQRAAGRAGLIGASLLFTATYLDLSTVALVMVLALAGLVFALSVAHSGTLTGAIAGHVLLAVGAGALWPVLLGRHHPAWLHEPGATIGLGVAVLGMAAAMLRRHR
jgi:membrane protease YdiL (CAAX protease family)